MPVDGPSAGVALATAIYSAIKGVPVDNETALTGEISIRGNVKPVGGVVAKVNAAMQAGARKVLIPQDNWQSIFKDIGIEVVPVTRIEQVLEHMLLPQEKVSERTGTQEKPADIMTASPLAR